MSSTNPPISHPLRILLITTPQTPKPTLLEGNRHLPSVAPFAYSQLEPLKFEHIPLLKYRTNPQPNHPILLRLCPHLARNPPCLLRRRRRPRGMGNRMAPPGSQRSGPEHRRMGRRVQKARGADRRRRPGMLPSNSLPPSSYTSWKEHTSCASLGKGVEEKQNCLVSDTPVILRGLLNRTRSSAC